MRVPVKSTWRTRLLLLLAAVAAAIITWLQAERRREAETAREQRSAQAAEQGYTVEVELDE